MKWYHGFKFLDTDSLSIFMQSIAGLYSCKSNIQYIVLICLLHYDLLYVINKTLIDTKSVWKLFCKLFLRDFSFIDALVHATEIRTEKEKQNIEEHITIKWIEYIYVVLCIISTTQVV